MQLQFIEHFDFNGCSKCLNTDISVRECLFWGMQKIFAQIWFSQITYKQKVLMLRLKRTIVSKSRCLHV